MCGGCRVYSRRADEVCLRRRAVFDEIRWIGTMPCKKQDYRKDVAECLECKACTCKYRTQPSGEENDPCRLGD